MNKSSPFNKLEEQYQMSNYFAKTIMQKLKKNNISFTQFCQILNVSPYYLRKVIDRNIQASCYISLLEKIAEIINVSGIKLYK